MEYYKRTLCVTFEELTGGDAIISANTLRQNMKRGNIQCARQGKGEGRYALYVYDSLPQKYRVAFEAKYGNPVDILKTQELRDRVKEDQDARTFFEEKFKYDMNGVQTTLSDKLKDEYTLNASVLKMLLTRMDELIATTHALGGGRRKDLWDIVYAQSEKLREATGHTLPKNLSRLKEKMAAFKKEGYRSLVSGKVGNSNTLKITEEAGRRLVSLKRSRVPVLNDSQIFAAFNSEAEGKGWKPLKSIAGMKAWLNSPAIEPLWYDAVHGERASHQRFDRKHRTILPTKRDSLWYGDGTKLNLYYRGDDGEMYTINVYEVVDAATEVFLGYYIGEKENYVAQYHAYRMAIQVSGHKPYEIVYDNQGGHKKNTAAGLFSKICNIHRPTAPYNGESKTIENIFYRFQKDVLHKRWGYTGQNVICKKDSSRPNIEFVEANVSQLPTLDELMDIYADARREWNEMPHPATGRPRIEMYNESVNEETQEVGVYDMIDMFWFTTDKPSIFGTRGIEITIDGQKYAYEVFSEPGVPDMEWRRRNTYRKFYVQYDPYEMTSVRLLYKDKAGDMRFARVAEPPIVIHRAQQDQTAEEKRFIRDMQDTVFAERAERQVAARTLEHDHGVAPEQHGLRTPALKGLPKEIQRQIDRRVRQYSGEPEEYQLGKRAKTISLMTYDRLEGGKRDYGRTANYKL